MAPRNQRILVSRPPQVPVWIAYIQPRSLSAGVESTYFFRGVNSGVVWLYRYMSEARGLPVALKFTVTVLGPIVICGASGYFDLIASATRCQSLYFESDDLAVSSPLLLSNPFIMPRFSTFFGLLLFLPDGLPRLEKLFFEDLAEIPSDVGAEVFCEVCRTPHTA